MFLEIKELNKIKVKGGIESDLFGRFPAFKIDPNRSANKNIIVQDK